MSLLAIGSNDVRIIGVWGMGGIGKTTLARFVYWMIFNDFQGGSFITNIREESEEHGLLPSQQKLICEILRERSMNIQDVDDGVLMIKNRLCHKRIILVLDDVNQFDQLKKLAGEPNWFGAGSRVIITTRDKHLLIRHKVCGIYEVKGLKDDDALHLFSLNSFNKDHPTQDYLKLSKQCVNYAQGLPLAIEVLGSFLFNRSKEEWESALDRLKEFLVEEMSKILQISFDGLHRVEQEIFLHMACFFNMKDKDYVVEIPDCLGLHPKIGLNVLIEKSLLQEYENKFCMHELLQKMGQDIIRREYPQEPRKWSRLWRHKDMHNVLMKNMEAEAVQGIVLVLPKMRELGELQKFVKAHWNLDAFSKLPNLKLLIIHSVHLPHGPKHLPNDLRYLDWSRYPSKSLPSSFQPNELIELRTCNSKIVRLWNGIKDIDKESIESTLAAIFGIVIPGSEIPRWFSHQSVGATVNAQVTHLNKNVLSKWIGMAVCVVFSGRNLHPNNHVLSNYLYLSCEILVNKHEGATFSEILGKKSVQIKPDHLWLFYLPPQNFNENGRALLSQIDENGFIQIEVRFDCPVLQCLEVKKCGFRLVYKQDIEDIRYMMAHSSNNTCITPYEGLDVHHDFDNSAEAIKIKGSHDKYDGVGPSSEGRLGSSFDVPNSKKIERYIKDVWLMVTPIILTLIMVTLIARIVM